MEILGKLGIERINEGSCCGPKPEDWLESQNVEPISVINPATETTVAKVKRCSADAYEKVIQSAEAAFLLWREVPAPKRGEIVRQIGNRLRANKVELAQLITWEMGKPLQESYGEVQEMIDMADFVVGQSRMLYGKTMPSERLHHRLCEQWHPLGVVGVITAFNFPVAVWSWNAFLAAICGNTVVWKPSSQTPLSAIAVQNICNHVLEENHCPAVFSMFIPESRALLEQFVDDRRVHLISFTGSTETGRRVGVRVAKRLGKCLLELSGNNAMIVDETANLELAIRSIVFSAIGTSGQRCTTLRRLFVQDVLYETLVDNLVEIYQKIPVGDPSDLKILMGPLVNQPAVNAYKEAIQEAKQQGAKVFYGGNAYPPPGYFVEPALIKADHDWPIVHRETFAPILYVMPFENLEQALRWNNESSHGLSSSLFTNHFKHMEKFLSVLGSDCGIANINTGTSGAEIGGAFGGEKDTGGGREAGSDVWKTYMRRQTSTINFGNELPFAQGIDFNL